MTFARPTIYGSITSIFTWKVPMHLLPYLLMLLFVMKSAHIFLTKSFKFNCTFLKRVCTLNENVIRIINGITISKSYISIL